MFKLIDKYEINRDILKCDYIRYSPSEISTINTANSQIYINIPREDSVISLLNSYLDLNFDVLHAATNNRYADNNDIRLVNLGPVALFSNYKLTTSSGKHLEDINHAHIVSLMYKLITSPKGSDDLSVGFDRDRNRRQRELTNNKNVKGKYHIRIYLRDVFGFAEWQEKGTYGLGYKLTTSSGKHLEDISHAHIVSLLYKLINSAEGSDDLSIGFDRDRNRRQRELTNNKNVKGRYHIRIYLRDVFGFAEWQEKGTYGLGYKLTLTRNSDNAVLNKDNAIAIGKVKINAIEWYVPHYTPSMSKQDLLMKQILNKIPTELNYVERSVFMKELNTQNLWSFELGTQEGINVPIWIIVGFQQQDSQNSQNETMIRFIGLQ